MKRQIRRNVFETNSSSVHSISICNAGNVSPSILYIVDDKINVGFGEFGCGIDTLTSQKEKLEYLVTMFVLLECNNIKDLSEIYEKDGFMLLNNEISTYCNCAGINIIGEMEISKYYSNGNNKSYVSIDGYIDHQSTKDYSSLQHFLTANNTNVIDFVFNNDISMLIDNDNH